MMFPAQTIVLYSLAVLVFLQGSSCRNTGAQDRSANQSQPSSQNKALENEVWGGQGISLEIKDSGAEINYDCAHGTIEGKIAPDRAGKFAAKGLHIREHGAAVRQDENNNGQPATYRGLIEGGTMTLTVVLSDSKETVGTFTLKRGNSGKVTKCM